MIWHGEFIVTTQSILEKEYENNKEVFDRDYEFAKKAFK
jgi:hypothetical protein